MQAPKDRDALFAAVLAAVDSDFVDINDVRALAAKIEALGVSFIPTAVIPKDVVNPYASPKKQG